MHKLAKAARTCSVAQELGRSICLATRKQVYRHQSGQGQRMQTGITTIEDGVPLGKPLIQPVMKDGQRLQLA
jgi:hypothetical protein